MLTASVVGVICVNVYSKGGEERRSGGREGGEERREGEKGRMRRGGGEEVE